MIQFDRNNIVSSVAATARRQRLARRLTVSLVLVAALVAAAAAVAASGDLDLGFGTAGKVQVAHVSFSDGANAVVVLPNGKLIFAGRSYKQKARFLLGRLDPNGNLDTSFGPGQTGIVRTALGPWEDAAYALALQPNGKLIAVGHSQPSNSYWRFALARYNANGSLDATFGVGGKVTTPFSGSDASARALVVQPDGKIILAGSVGNEQNLRFALARYNASGSLDATFGVGGKVTTLISTGVIAQAVILQPDGKLVAAGGVVGLSQLSGFTLVRYNANGSLDATFGVGGKVTTNIGNQHDSVSSLLLQPDGKLVAAGNSYGAVGFLNWALARYNANGSLDTTFGVGGKVTTSIASGTSVSLFNKSRVGGLVLQSDGKLVVSGGAPSGTQLRFTLLRRNADGSPDPTFGVGGKVTTSVGIGGGRANALALQSDGKLVAAGSSAGAQPRTVLARYLP